MAKQTKTKESAALFAESSDAAATKETQPTTAASPDTTKEAVKEVLNELIAQSLTDIQPDVTKPKERRLHHELDAEFLTNPDRKRAYVHIDGDKWFFDEHRARKNFKDDFEVVENSYHN